MGHQTATSSQKKPSPTVSIKSSSSSSSRKSNPPTTASSSSSYLTAVANSNAPYESPYAQNKDKKPTSRPISEQTVLSAPNPIRESTSAYSSSSSGGSVYTSSPAPPQYRQTTPGTMSNSRTMSSVSQFLHLSAVFCQHLFIHILPTLPALFSLISDSYIKYRESCDVIGVLSRSVRCCPLSSAGLSFGPYPTVVRVSTATAFSGKAITNSCCSRTTRANLFAR